MAACGNHDDDRAALTANAARDLAGHAPPAAANAITPFAASDPAPSTEAVLPPLAVRSPARASTDGGAVEPLVTPVIHTVD